jgi:hypothetical protein
MKIGLETIENETKIDSKTTISLHDLASLFMISTSLLSLFKVGSSQMITQDTKIKFDDLFLDLQSIQSSFSKTSKTVMNEKNEKDKETSYSTSNSTK